MPSPRNRLKLTGDTHLPDILDDGSADDGDDTGTQAGSDAGSFAEAGTPEEVIGMQPSQASMPAFPSADGMLRGFRAQVSGQPLVFLAAAFVVGYLVGRPSR